MTDTARDGRRSLLGPATRGTGPPATDAVVDPAPDLPWIDRATRRPRPRSDADDPAGWHRIIGHVVVATLVVLAVVGTGSTFLARRSAEREAVHDAAAVTDLLAAGTVEPLLTGTAFADADAARDVLAPVARALVPAPVTRVKLWSDTATVLWSDEPRLAGRSFAFDGEALEALQSGHTVAAVSDLRRPENVFERGRGPMLEVYRPVRTPSGSVLLLEAYFSYDTVSAQTSRIWREFAGITLCSLVALLLLLAPVVGGLVGRTRRARQQQDALLRHAADVSLSERRRIAGALHDGLVQDLVAASYVIAAEAEAAERVHDAAAARSLRTAAETVRSGIGGLRALLVDLYPPHLRSAGLTAALRDVATSSGARGVDVVVAIDELAVARLDVDQQEATFRVGQEAIRNADQHARAYAVLVQIVEDGDVVRLEVSDDGVGMDPAELVGRADGFGQRLMVDQAERIGATLAVRTAPGRGTAVRLEVPVG